VMVDPAPLAEPRPVVLAVWRNIGDAPRPYLLLLSKTGTMEEAITAGANDVLNKPFSSFDIDTKLLNAERLLEISHHLAKEDHIHSGNGMVGKAAFNQLFHSAIDRAIRYGERTLIVFLHFSNYDDIVEKLGQEEGDNVMQKLSEQMTFMRRQSDVIGRLGLKDFAIILQRPQNDAEPLDAMSRFCEMLDKFHRKFPEKELAPCIELHLVEVPQGHLHAERNVPLPEMEEAVEGGT
ncbi:MAG: diguanylate cyclase, partial [Alphaproteobacteria bacterium]|nr:diguanylate cyclase [Alphaproteobacteria bacterium]